jgi:plasmid replication initiation protein
MANKKLTVYKANQVIEAGYRLTLNEQRVVLACITQVNSKEALLVTDQFELSAKDFAKLFSVSEDRAYHALVEVTESLFNRYIVIDKPFPHDPTITSLKTRWISTIYYKADSGKVVLCFAQAMLPYLSELKGQFTRYDLEHIGKMTSIYAICLYELLAQWQSIGKREIELDWLKKQFEIEDLYPDMHNLKKRVLDPAVKDINTHSNFEVTWEQRKTGRKVTHLIFTFAEKQLLTPKKQKKTATKVNVKKETVKIDNIEHFAALRKELGDAATAGIPDDVVDILTAQGRW